MNTKKIPAIVMLLGCATACLITYFQHYSFKEMLVVLAIVLIVFLVLGLIVKGILDSIHLPDEDAVSPEGEMVEKTDEDGNGAEASASEKSESKDNGTTVISEEQ